jgi:hypothetical protein
MYVPVQWHGGDDKQTHARLLPGAGYEVGTIMLIYTMALAYGVSSPIILPLALIYFIVQLCAPPCGWSGCCGWRRGRVVYACKSRSQARMLFTDTPAGL